MCCSAGLNLRIGTGNFILVQKASELDLRVVTEKTSFGSSAPSSPLPQPWDNQGLSSPLHAGTLGTQLEG